MKIAELSSELGIANFTGLNRILKSFFNFNTSSLN